MPSPQSTQGCGCLPPGPAAVGTEARRDAYVVHLSGSVTMKDTSLRTNMWPCIYAHTPVDIHVHTYIHTTHYIRLAYCI